MLSQKKCSPLPLARSSKMSDSMKKNAINCHWSLPIGEFCSRVILIISEIPDRNGSNINKHKRK